MSGGLSRVKGSASPRHFKRASSLWRLDIAHLIDDDSGGVFAIGCARFQRAGLNCGFRTCRALIWLYSTWWTLAKFYCKWWQVCCLPSWSVRTLHSSRVFNTTLLPSFAGFCSATKGRADQGAAAISGNDAMCEGRITTLKGPLAAFDDAIYVTLTLHTVIIGSSAQNRIVPKQISGFSFSNQSTLLLLKVLRSTSRPTGSSWRFMSTPVSLPM